MTTTTSGVSFEQVARFADMIENNIETMKMQSFVSDNMKATVIYDGAAYHVVEAVFNGDINPVHANVLNRLLNCRKS